MTRRTLIGPGAMVVAAILVGCAALTVAALAGRGAPVTRAQQAHDIAASLHCPVCKDLSAADSPAPLARQMRQQIRQQLAAGSTPTQIRQSFVAAYGPSVLMSPPNDGLGRAAHVAPFLLLAGAIALGGLTVRRGLRSEAATRAPEHSSMLDTDDRRTVELALAQLRQEEP
jgi:cytochrome c-type biogenesis protein CcmH